MSSLAAIQAERRRLGALKRLVFREDSFVAAHEALGAALGTVIRRITWARLKSATPESFALQLGVMRQSRQHLLNVAQRTKSKPLRSAIEEYLACLTAWADGAQITRCLPVAARLAPSDSPTTDDLALWLQDDNVGCQTGLLRLDGGRVLFWHTEEDTSGYVDHSRLVTMSVPQGTWHAFLYPYLLPGPAFCFTAGRFFALDSLHIRRRPNIAGILTGTVAWLVWRLANEVRARDVIRAIAPYVDGSTINEINACGRKVVAESHEFGNSAIQSRLLSPISGECEFQVNMVCDNRSPLGRVESLPSGEREKYLRRFGRTTEALQRLLGTGKDDRFPIPQQIVGLLADRRGGEYAYANVDVKAYCVGVAAPGKIELFVGAGPALATDVYAPQFEF